jgi:5-methylcytosine-specific restriction protein A
MPQSTFLLTWNPTKWQWPNDKLRDQLSLTARGIAAHDRWSTGIRKSGIRAGDRAFLLRQHSERGIVASGVFTAEISEHKHWDGSGKTAHYADLMWDRLVTADQRLDVEVLKSELPQVAWDRVQGSGIHIPTPVAELLEELWSQAAPPATVALLDEASVHEFAEGAVTQVLVNRYERNAAARLACIAHHKAKCTVCDFDFGERYGEHGRGYIEVHHLSELSSIGQSYTVNPIEDLRPVCANCHAMLHRGPKLLTPDELRALLQR